MFRTQNLRPGSNFLFSEQQNLFPQHVFIARLNWETFASATMFSQQCFLVYPGLKGEDMYFYAQHCQACWLWKLIQEPSTDYLRSSFFNTMWGGWGRGGKKRIARLVGYQGVSAKTTAIATTTTPENNDLIGWVRECNRAARAARTLIQLFDVFCQMPTWNFQI